MNDRFDGQWNRCLITLLSLVKNLVLMLDLNKHTFITSILAVTVVLTVTSALHPARDLLLTSSISGWSNLVWDWLNVFCPPLLHCFALSQVTAQTNKQTCNSKQDGLLVSQTSRRSQQIFIILGIAFETASNKISY